MKDNLQMISRFEKVALNSLPANTAVNNWFRGCK